MLADRGECGPGGGRGGDLVALRPHEVRGQLQVRHVVVDDQDPRGNEVALRGTTAGQVPPAPRLLRTPTLPPWASTSRRVSASPRPVPWWRFATPAPAGGR